MVALEQAVSAPMCTRTLGDFGARVIKVENPGGGDFARHYDDVVDGLARALRVGQPGQGVGGAGPEVSRPEWRCCTGCSTAPTCWSPTSPPAPPTELGISPADLAASHPRADPRGDRRLRPRRPAVPQARLRPARPGRVGSVLGHRHPGAPAKPGPPMADACTGLYAALSVWRCCAASGPRTGPGAPSRSACSTPWPS